MVKRLNSLKILIVLMLSIIVLSACSLNDIEKQDKDKNQDNNDNLQNNLDNTNDDLNNNENNIDSNTHQLKEFKSKEDIESYLLKIATKEASSNNYYGRSLGMVESDMMMEESIDSVVKSVDDGASQSNTGSYAQDYSQTNVQVKNVDEADIVKNDGKYIYTVSENNVVILDAYPAENAKIISKINFKSKPNELFINDNKLVVFNREYKRIEVVDENSFVPQKRSQSFTNIFIYNIENKEKPQLINNYSVSGNYYDSRMIDDYVYVISKEYLNYHYIDGITMPEIYNGNSKIMTPSVYCFDNPFSDYNFHTIASIDLSKDESNINAKTFMLGSSNTLYVSENNIYIAYKNYYSYDKLDAFKVAVIPNFNKKVQDELNDIVKNAKFQSDVNWNEVTSILGNTYNTMQEDDKKDLIEKIEDSLNEYYEKKTIENQKTQIHKINIDKENIEYDTKGEVEGSLLNQFSLDEKDNNLRVATTTSYWSRTSNHQQYNNVYVLDDSMEVIGKLENLAQDERIYSTRFMQDKLYMVTFKQIDPLFVIDLKDPKNPEVLGELKIPGYSTYLHPYDEDYLIGIGYDTKESEWGGVVNNGVKLSLFDVSDFSNPKEVDVYIVEGRYTDSIALHEHKAFLFDRNKNLLVMPVREYIEKGDDNRYGYYYNFDISAFVFDIDHNGFDLKGKVMHEKNSQGYSYWERSANSIQRTLFMDDVLYTISEEKILASNLNDLDLISDIDLGYEYNDKYDDIIYY